MALFRRSKSDRSSVPAWCAWFSAEEWTAFRDLVRECLAQDYAGQPSISWVPGGSPAPELDLVRLAGWLRNRAREQWRATVAEYPQRCADGEREARAQRMTPFDAARGALLPAVRLSGESEDRLDAMTRIVGGGLLAEVRLTGEYGDLVVGTEQARRWDVSPAEVWSVAMANLRRRPCDIHEVVPGDSPLCAVLGSGPHTAAHVLRMDELAGRPAPHGILLVLPRTDVLAFWVVDGPGLFTAAPAVQKYGGNLYDVPRSPERRLSQELFWWSDGRLERVTFPDWQAEAAAGLGTSDRPHTIQASERFLDMLHSLASPPRDR
jgi:hypothetical protein